MINFLFGNGSISIFLIWCRTNTRPHYKYNLLYLFFESRKKVWITCTVPARQLTAKTEQSTIGTTLVVAQRRCWGTAILKLFALVAIKAPSCSIGSTIAENTASEMPQNRAAFMPWLSWDFIAEMRIKLEWRRPNYFKIGQNDEIVWTTSYIL